MWCGSASMATACARWLAEVEVFGDDDDVVDDLEAAAVGFRIEADFGAGGNADVLVDDGALYAAVPANVDGFVQDALLDLGEAVDADARAEHALVDVAARLLIPSPRRALVVRSSR